MLQDGGIGNSHAVVEDGFQSRLFQALGDLWPGAVHQHQSHPQAAEQGDVVENAGKVLVLGHLAPQHQHEGLAPVRIDVGCGIPQPANIVPAGRCHFLVQAIEK